MHIHSFLHGLGFAIQCYQKFQTGTVILNALHQVKYGISCTNGCIDRDLNTLGFSEPPIPFPSTIQFQSLAQDFFLFFHIPTVRYFELMPLALSEAGMDGRSIFPTLVPENGCGFFVGCLPNGTPELRSNFQRYFLLADFSGFRKVRGLR